MVKLQYGSATHPMWDEDIVYSTWKHVAKCTKNREFGQTGFIRCDFDPANRRIFQENIGDKIVYGWDHNGINLPEHPANELEEFQLQSNKDAKQNPF